MPAWSAGIRTVTAARSGGSDKSHHGVIFVDCVIRYRELLATIRSSKVLEVCSSYSRVRDRTTPATKRKLRDEAALAAGERADAVGRHLGQVCLPRPASRRHF
jgi:hypothetical protein